MSSSNNPQVRILNNKGKFKCGLCEKEVVEGNKIRIQQLYEKRPRYYHLRCYFLYCVKNLKSSKERSSHFQKMIRRLQKYKKQMMVDSLQ